MYQGGERAAGGHLEHRAVTAAATSSSRPIEIPVAALNEFGGGSSKSTHQSLHWLKDLGSLGKQGKRPT